MDLSKFPNPYDFANPVADPDLFFGRTSEMSEIRYYLDHAKNAPRPINLAIIGDRASGKTSVLNMTGHEAKKRDFLVVRIELDEGDAEAQLAFFYKIFDSLITTVCTSGAYGGLSGKTYDTYRNMVDAFEIPEDKSFCPFVFPIQYANAMRKGNAHVLLSDTIFKQDLATLHAELQQLCVILLDEGDVLAKSRVHLQKLRNVFMNVPGFMLVLIGTSALFPLMDDVFSPIVRQFKRIVIGPFKDWEETDKCIKKPLEKVGIARPNKIIDPHPFLFVQEIHELSGGRPYEIQLICHIIFRRIQLGRTKRMELTLDVLDDVRKELETSQDVTIRPVLSAVRNFTKDQLAALNLVCACDGRATFEQIWFSESIFRGETRWTKEVLCDHLLRFQELNVITLKDDLISFQGDDFDRIYCKYFARKQDVPLVIGQAPYESHLGMGLHAAILKSGRIEPLFPVGLEALERAELEALAGLLATDDPVADPFQTRPDAAIDLYWASIDFREADSVEVGEVRLESPWRLVRRWYRPSDASQPPQSWLNDLRSSVAEIAERASRMGGAVDVDVYSLPVARLETLRRKVQMTGNAWARDLIAARHLIKMSQNYLKDRNVDRALFDGERAYEYDPNRKVANNLGYIYIVKGDLAKARDLLEEAIRKHKDSKERAVSNYNLGIVELKFGNLKEAVRRFEVSMEEIRDANEAERIMACLLVPKSADREKCIEFEEVTQPDLLEKATSAHHLVMGLLLESQ